MRLTNLKDLIKLKKKNVGNIKLVKAIDELIDDLQNNSFKSFDELKEVRNDVDRVHPEGFYFFDINVHRTMIMVGFDDGQAVVVWVGSHDDYENTFRNNKTTIEKWLRERGYIE